MLWQKLIINDKRRMSILMLETILSKCDKRNSQHGCEQCADCSYDTYCPHDCEKCLDYIHNPSHAPDGAPERKYDCTHMANVYTCKYSNLRGLFYLQNERQSCIQGKAIVDYSIWNVPQNILSSNLTFSVNYGTIQM